MGEEKLQAGKNSLAQIASDGVLFFLGEPKGRKAVIHALEAKYPGLACPGSPPNSCSERNGVILQLDPKMRESIEAIKAELKNGGARGIVVRPRQTGKTIALLEFVHENDPGNMIVVTCNTNTAEHMRYSYKQLFPEDAQPTFKPYHRVDNRDVLGSTRRWVTDEIWPGAVVKNAPAYELHEHLGTVGTPMCMDIHS